MWLLIMVSQIISVVREKNGRRDGDRVLSGQHSTCSVTMGCCDLTCCGWAVWTGECSGEEMGSSGLRSNGPLLAPDKARPLDHLITPPTLIYVQQPKDKPIRHQCRYRY